MTDVRCILAHLFLLSGAISLPRLDARAQSSTGTAPATAERRSLEADGSHGFDFEIGTWKTRLTRLVHPLSGSREWVSYEGLTKVTKVWNGRANLVELTADGPAGHIEALNLRLYNPISHQWSLNFASSRSGALGVPTIGRFVNGRGEFYDQEIFDDRAVLVRFVISDAAPGSCFAVSSASPNVCRFEQAFSEDGGRTWEVNWIATDTRVSR
jgi:hypothetical protein